MKPFTLAVFVVAAFAVCAQASPVSLTLLPASGVVGGEPGTAVGWGFTLTDNTDWVILLGSSGFAPTPYGTYTDYTGNSFDLAGPGDGVTLTQNWGGPSSGEGLGEFDIYSTAPSGTVISGTLVVSYAEFSVDPMSGSFDPDTDTICSDCSLAVSAQVGVSPEPSSFLLMSTALLPFALAGWRRRRARRL